MCVLVNHRPSDRTVHCHSFLRGTLKEARGGSRPCKERESALSPLPRHAPLQKITEGPPTLLAVPRSNERLLERIEHFRNRSLLRTPSGKRPQVRKAI
ncbi:hypothetical protein CDAR_524721 [Caerostris darwini]|uniref:Uncharacterized protein n=1 Tax=Caerostris darwini TaxID=1538125 RepID=A0AAV4R0I8_9ARAC|nr:hypothetical protein CDAR_524721 [Caerostris darwini]